MQKDVVCKVLRHWKERETAGLVVLEFHHYINSDGDLQRVGSSEKEQEKPRRGKTTRGKKTATVKKTQAKPAAKPSKKGKGRARESDEESEDEIYNGEWTESEKEGGEEERSTGSSAEEDEDEDELPKRVSIRRKRSVVPDEGDEGEGDDEREKDDEDEQEEEQEEEAPAMEISKPAMKTYTSSVKRRRSSAAVGVETSPRRSPDEAPRPKKKKHIPDSSSDDGNDGEAVRTCFGHDVFNGHPANHHSQGSINLQPDDVFAFAEGVGNESHAEPIAPAEDDSRRYAIAEDFVDDNGNHTFPLPLNRAPFDVELNIAARKHYLEELSDNEDYQTSVSYYTRVEIVSRRVSAGTKAD